MLHPIIGRDVLYLAFHPYFTLPERHPLGSLPWHMV